MTSETESCESNERSTNRTGRGAVVFVSVLLGYLLSPIPVAWCLVKIGAFEAVEPVWEFIYVPIWFLTDRFEYANEFYEWQSGLFGF